MNKIQMVNRLNRLDVTSNSIMALVYGITGNFMIVNYKLITDNQELLTQILNGGGIFGSIIMLIFPLLRYKKMTTAYKLELVISYVYILVLLYSIIYSNYVVALLYYIYGNGIVILICHKTTTLNKRFSGRIYKHHFGLVSETLSNAFINNSTRFGLIGIIISSIIVMLKPEFSAILIIITVSELLLFMITYKMYKIAKEIEDNSTVINE